MARIGYQRGKLSHERTPVSRRPSVSCLLKIRYLPGFVKRIFSSALDGGAESPNCTVRDALARHEVTRLLLFFLIFWFEHSEAVAGL